MRLWNIHSFSIRCLNFGRNIQLLKLPTWAFSGYHIGRRQGLADIYLGTNWPFSILHSSIYLHYNLSRWRYQVLSSRGSIFLTQLPYLTKCRGTLIFLFPLCLDFEFMASVEDRKFLDYHATLYGFPKFQSALVESFLMPCDSLEVQNSFSSKSPT